MRKLIKFLATSLVLLVAAGVLAAKYWDYIVNPWTRDGQVRAIVIQVTPRVSAPIITLPVKDNQFVKQGELLFAIDPRTFKAAKDQAAADLKQAQTQVAEAKDEADRIARIRKADRGAASKQQEIKKRSVQRQAEAGVLEAQAALEKAGLDLEFTEVKAPVDGYITNLNVQLGSQAVANQPIMALVDSNSFWIVGFFRETMIENIRSGDRVIVTLMTYPDRPIEGRVESIGWGIAQDDGSTGYNLLPNISPTFQWIRLAQRVPVRVHTEKLPKGVELRVGTTASVMVMTGTRVSESNTPVPPVPQALQ